MDDQMTNRKNNAHDVHAQSTREFKSAHTILPSERTSQLSARSKFHNSRVQRSCSAWLGWLANKEHSDEFANQPLNGMIDDHKLHERDQPCTIMSPSPMANLTITSWEPLIWVGRSYWRMRIEWGRRSCKH